MEETDSGRRLEANVLDDLEILSFTREVAAGSAGPTRNRLDFSVDEKMQQTSFGRGRGFFKPRGSHKVNSDPRSYMTSFNSGHHHSDQDVIFVGARKARENNGFGRGAPPDMHSVVADLQREMRECGINDEHNNRVIRMRYEERLSAKCSTPEIIHLSDSDEGTPTLGSKSFQFPTSPSSSSTSSSSSSFPGAKPKKSKKKFNYKKSE